MDINNADFKLIDKEAKKEVIRLQKKIRREKSPNELREQMKALKMMLDIRDEVSRCIFQKKKSFHPSTLENSFLERNSQVISEVIRELSHECQRQLLIQNGNMRHCHDDIGPYKPVQRRAA